ncbi:MAG: hypothetical protein LWW87_14025 [Geobacteraceae bacterium]|nr:hypothetical protein [Geobacteraceae bacterium]
MEMTTIQDSTASRYQHQKAVDQAQQTSPEQQSTVAREAEVNSSSALQAYKQQGSERSAATDTVQIKSTVTLKNLDTVKAIEQMHAKLNDLVKGVRQTNEELNRAVDQVSQMQGNLMAIVKNYPPYPIDSMQRKELLMSYMSLRKEIESLMVPPPPPPVYEKIKSMWSAMFAQNGQLQASAVPPLENGSSDKQVQTTSDVLGRTIQQLSDLSTDVTQALVQP